MKRNKKEVAKLRGMEGNAEGKEGRMNRRVEVVWRWLRSRHLEVTGFLGLRSLGLLPGSLIGEVGVVHARLSPNEARGSGGADGDGDDEAVGVVERK